MPDAAAPPAALAGFLARCEQLSEETVVWGAGAGAIRLRLTTYLTTETPPLAYLTSARAIVFHRNEVLVVRDPDGCHVIPGGRREAGETLEETLRREVLEETGWTLGPIAPLGVLHFRHLDPQPPGPYPYPDFLNVVYAAEAIDHRPEALTPTTGAYELEAAFRPLPDVDRLELPAGQRRLLKAALATRAARR